MKKNTLIEGSTTKIMLIAIVLLVAILPFASAGLTVTLNTPTDNQISTSRDVNYNCSASTSSGTLTNISLWTNSTGTWHRNQTLNGFTGTPVSSTTGLTLSAVDSATGNKQGMKIKANANVKLSVAEIHSPSNPTTAYLTDSGLNILQQVSFVGLNATFDYLLSAGTTYYILADSGGGAYTRAFQPAGVSYPYANTNINITGGYGGGDDAGTVYLFDRLWTQVATSNMTSIFTSSITQSTKWNCQACANDGTCGFAPSNYTVNLDTTPPVVSITAPTGTYNYGIVGGTLGLNFTATDIGLSSCWYDYAGTNTTVGCTSGIANATNNITLTTAKTLTVYANDTVGNVGSAITSWDYKVFENAVAYNTTTYETAAETYAINITSDGTQSVTASLIWNGTTKTATKTGDNINMIFTSSFDIPTGSGVKNFYWDISYGGTHINSTSYTTTVSELVFAHCNATITTKVLNLTFKDETLGTYINATLDASSWSYYIGSGTVVKTFIYSNTTNHNPNYDFCISPASASSIKTTGVVYYSSTQGGTFPSRTQALNHTLSNSTLTTDILYLLNLNNGQTSNYQVISIGNQVIAGAYIQVYRDINGVSTLITDGYTDAAGTLSFFLSPTYDHTFIVSAAGFQSLTQTIRPSLTSYTFTLGTGSNPFWYTANLDGITYSKTPGSGPINNTGIHTFTFYAHSSMGNKIFNCTINIRYPNQTLLATATGCNSTAPLPGTGGFVSLSVNLTQLPTNDLYGQFLITITNSTGGAVQVVIENDARWKLVTPPMNRRYWSTLVGFFQDMTNLPEWGDVCAEGYTLNTTDNYCYADDGIGDGTNGAKYWHQTTDFSRIVFFFIVFAIIMALINFAKGYDTAYPGAMMIIMMFTVVFLSAINGFTGTGFFYLPGATYGGGYFSGFTTILDNWILAVHFILLGAIYFFTTNKRYSAG